jgi:hypothetical protein
MKWFGLCCLATSLADGAHAASVWKPEARVREARVDLDGDGKREHIRIAAFRVKTDGVWQDGPFRLTVNGQTIFGEGWDASRFRIADIDRRDRYKEILVDCSEPSGGFNGLLFSYVNKKLGRMHKDELVGPEFPGNGIVVEGYWHGFWASKERHRLNSRHKLTRIPQKFHRVGIRSRLQKPLALHPYRDVTRVTRVLPHNMKVVIVRSDRESWYEIRAPHGTRGWITEAELTAHMTENIRMGD